MNSQAYCNPRPGQVPHSEPSSSFITRSSPAGSRPRRCDGAARRAMMPEDGTAHGGYRRAAHTQPAWSRGLGALDEVKRRDSHAHGWSARGAGPHEIGEEMWAGLKRLLFAAKPRGLCQDDTALSCCVPLCSCAWSGKRRASGSSPLTGTDGAGRLLGIWGMGNLGGEVVWMVWETRGQASWSVSEKSMWALQACYPASSGVPVVVQVEEERGGLRTGFKAGWMSRATDPTRHLTRFVGRVWRGQSRDYA